MYGKAYSFSWSWELVEFETSEVSNDRLYTGREYDTEINLYYNRARHYDANLWRFIQRDPIDIADDVNLYSYVWNSPVMFTDPMGTDWKPVLVIGLYGWNPTEYTDTPTSRFNNGVWSILNELSKYENIETLHYNSWIINSWQSAAREYIQKNHQNYQKIVIIGHSKWADDGIEISRQLKKDNIDIDYMLTIDLQSLIWDTNRPKDNVKKLDNYHQTTSAWVPARIPWTWIYVPIINTNWAKVHWKNVTNYPVESFCDLEGCEKWSQYDTVINHNNIDNDGVFFFTNKILEVIN